MIAIRVGTDRNGESRFQDTQNKKTDFWLEFDRLHLLFQDKQTIVFSRLLQCLQNLFLRKKNYERVPCKIIMKENSGYLQEFSSKLM